jgi:hypothetical protein
MQCHPSTAANFNILEPPLDIAITIGARSQQGFNPVEYLIEKQAKGTSSHRGGLLG